MTFEEILDQAVAMLQRRGRVTYRTLKLQFKLDDETLEALKDELLYSQPQVVDDEGKGLIWTGESERKPEPVSAQPDQPVVTPEAQSIQVEPPPSPEPSTPDAERRQLTVMFCDLADSTKLSGQLDPEDLRDVVRAYQSTSATVIVRYDGHIAQHLGDGLMVYFGWPQAHEDDAQRAVHAGLDILQAMAGLNTRLEQEKGIRLGVRIGIHTGLVVVGEIGSGASQEHLALGETPNLASRIEGVAEPDTVAISDATYQLVQGYFECEELGQHALKGLGEPQQVYRAVRASGAQSRLDVGVTKGLTPLVGREQEVGLLFERWQQVKEGQGQVVLLSGEAGIGKSRLLQVMKDHVANEAYSLLECRSSPYYQNTALYPITDMFQRVLSWNQDDTPEAKLDSLEQMLSQYHFELEEATPLFAPLFSLPIPEDRYQFLNLSPQRQRQKTLEMIVAMLIQQTEHQPVLFILEDLHWTDPSTLELLDLLIDQIPTVAVCVLLTHRPAFQPPWSVRSYFTQITLNHLSRNQIEHMAERVAGGKGLPNNVLQQIVEKTDGIPLFVEEMTKAVLESGALQEVDGHYELVGSLSSSVIPATLQDSLMARLDRLVTAKGVAQYAAIIGRQFSFELLAVVCQLDAAMLQHELERLVEAELLYQRGLPPRATYVFKHALIQDTAYESLLKSTRQQVHQKVAQHIEAQFPDTAENQPELLAHHYTQAGQSEQAIPYWLGAGQRSIENSAHVEAIAHLTEGLTSLTTLPEKSDRLHQELDFQVALGIVYRATKGNAAPEVKGSYTRALKLCQQIGDSPQLFSVLRGLMVHHHARAQFQTAYQLGEQLLHLAQSQHDSTRLMIAHYVLGRLLYNKGELVAAHTHHTQALAIYEPQEHQPMALRDGTPDTGMNTHSHLAWEMWQLGYPDQALQHIQAAIKLAQDMSHLYSLVHALVFAAMLYQFRRDTLTVHEQAGAAITLGTEQGFSDFVSRGKVFHGWSLVMKGQRKEGIAEIREGQVAMLAIGNKQLHSYWLGLLAEAYGESGHPEEGLPLLIEALAVMDNTEVRFYEAEIHRFKGELLLQQTSDNATEAETCFQQAIAIARHQQAKSWELRAATSLARLWQSQGKRQEAYELLASVYGWFTEGFDTADLQDAKALLEELA